MRFALAELTGDRAVETNGNIEQRLATLEKEVADLRCKVNGSTQDGRPVAWFDNVSGSMMDLPDDVYDAFLECCREVRKSQNDSGE